jgi:hypothetical protein
MIRVLPEIAVLRLLLATGMVRVLGWPLLAAPGQPGRATQRMLLEFHGQMLSNRAFTRGSVVRLSPLIGIANAAGPALA